MLISSGVLSPLDLPRIDLANFGGYVLWSVWLVIFAIMILRNQGSVTSEAAPKLITTEL